MGHLVSLRTTDKCMTTHGDPDIPLEQQGHHERGEEEEGHPDPWANDSAFTTVFYVSAGWGSVIITVRTNNRVRKQPVDTDRGQE